MTLVPGRYQSSVWYLIKSVCHDNLPPQPLRTGSMWLRIGRSRNFRGLSWRRVHQHSSASMNNLYSPLSHNIALMLIKVIS